MIFKLLDNNDYLIKIKQGYFKDGNIYDKEIIKEIVKQIFLKLSKKHNLKGFVYLDIYTNKYWDTIIRFKQKKYDFLENIVDVKIIFHINSLFLHEINYFDLIKFTNIKNQRLYYYSNKFYLELINPIKYKDNLKLSELSFLHYEDNMNIIINGIKIMI